MAAGDFRSAANTGYVSNHEVGSRPAGIQAGDFLWSFFYHEDSNPGTVTQPSGFSAPVVISGLHPNNSLYLFVAYKDNAAGGTSDNITWSRSGGGGGGVQVILCYEGPCEFDAAGTPVAANNVAASGSVTTTEDGATVIAFAGDYNNQTSAVPSGMTQRSNHSNIMRVADVVQATAGPSGTKTFSGSYGQKWGVAVSHAPAASGPTEVDVAGSLPAATGALAVKYLKSLAGALPSQAGEITAKQFAALAGALPSPAGALTAKYLIALAGDLPSAAGAIAAIKYLKTLAGSLPAQSGGITPVFANKQLGGTLGAFSGALTAKVTNKQLAGSLPPMTGAVQGAAARFVDVDGDLPAQSGALTPVFVNKQLAGDLPAGAGALEAAQSLARKTEGSLPAPTGAIAAKWVVRQVKGSLPSPTGGIAKKYLITLSGSLPAGAGALTSEAGGNLVSLDGALGPLSGALAADIVFRQESIGGSLPAATGALTARITLAHIALAGSMPAATGGLRPDIVYRQISLAGILGAFAGAISDRDLAVVIGRPPKPGAGSFHRQRPGAGRVFR